MIYCWEIGITPLFLIAYLKGRDADGVFKTQTQRKYDFRNGKILGKNDHIVEWKKPQQPAWMNRAEYAAYRDTMVYETVSFVDSLSFPSIVVDALFGMLRRLGCEKKT